ncbi:MAG: DUF1961 family protein [Planctomycetes bacterium]|nr:DUF1961 family protein [Planctomycetota bacterium]
MRKRTIAAVLVLACLTVSCEEGKVLFEDHFTGNLDAYFLEGQGKVSITNDGMLCIETKTPTVLWIKKEFPGDVRIDFDAMTPDKKARAILMFLAKGAKGESIFTWKRKGDYHEYAMDEKMVLYTIGMLRGFTKGVSNFRKLGARTKPEWKMLALGRRGEVSKKERKRINADFQKGTIMNGALDGCELGKVQHITCIKKGAKIKYFADGKLVHDITDDGAFGGKPLEGGFIGFRNFGKGTKVFYDNIVVRVSGRPM